MVCLSFQIQVSAVQMKKNKNEEEAIERVSLSLAGDLLQKIQNSSFDPSISRSLRQAFQSTPSSASIILDRIRTCKFLNYDSLHDPQLNVFFHYLAAVVEDVPDFDLLIPWNILALRSLDRCFVPLSKVVVSYCSELIRRDVNGNCARRLIDLLLDRYFSPNGTPPEAVRDILCRYAEYSSTQFFTKLDLYMSGKHAPTALRLFVSVVQSEGPHLIEIVRTPFWLLLLAYLQELLVEVAQPLLSLLPAADSASAPSHRSSHSSSSFSSSASHHGNKRSSSQPILPLSRRLLSSSPNSRCCRHSS